MTSSRARAEARFFTASGGPAPTTQQKEAVAVLRDHIVALAAQIEELTPPGRNQSLALTALEDVQMRANRAIFAPSDHL